MTNTATLAPASLLRQYLVLTKPRVTQLGCFLCRYRHVSGCSRPARSGHRGRGHAGHMDAGGCQAFAINCLIESQIDARMLRTARRGTARGTITPPQVLAMSGLLGGMGMLVLYYWVNPLTMWLTLATFIGYAVIYTS